MFPCQDPEVAKTISNLAVLTVRGTRRKPQVTEYIDPTTGEIIEAESAQRLGVRSIRPDAMMRRIKKLDSLRTEPRRFADFLLKFRDGRCKFLMPLDTIIAWYSKLTGKELHHIRRYFPALTKAEILDSDQMLNEDFMVNNPMAGKGAAKGELFRAYNIFDLLMLKQRPSLIG